MNRLTRRQFGIFAGAGTAALAMPTYLRAQGKPKVVVIGGGAGGATAARYIAKDSEGAIDVTLIDDSEQFTTCFFSNLYLGGFRSLDSLQFGYAEIAKLPGVRVAADRVTRIDRERKQVKSAALKLMLAPGAAQIYYGDEIARPMIDEQAYGDASMRVPMDWSSIEQEKTSEILSHWQKLGQFRQSHLAVGAGVHQQLSEAPYIFSRTLNDDRVMVALEMPVGEKRVTASEVFAEGTLVKDYYSGAEARVQDGVLVFDTEFDTLLLGASEKPQVSAR